jgi:hypothetical protein
MFGMTDVILRDRSFSAILLPIAIVGGQGFALLAVGLALFRSRRLP